MDPIETSGLDATSVAVVSGSLSRLAGGLFESVRYSSQAVAALGTKIEVYGLRDQHSDDLKAWAPLRPILIDTIGPAGLGIPRNLQEMLDLQMPDVVHQHGIWMAFSRDLMLWSRRRDRPTIISPRGMLDPWAIQNSRIKKRIAASLYEKRNLSGAHVLHALNKAEAQAIRRFGLTQPIAIIPNGVSLPTADVSLEAPTFLPKDGRRILLYLGRLHQKKRPAELLKAWISLCETGDATASNWRLVIAGWGEKIYEAELAALHARSGLGDQIILPGSIYGDEKLALLANSHAFILPSLSEGLPMAVLEAWSFGLPAFLSDACNLPEGFEANAAIRIGTETTALTQQIRDGLARGDLIDIGARGKNLVETRFTWNQIAKDLRELYLWCAKGGNSPTCVDWS